MSGSQLLAGNECMFVKCDVKTISKTVFILPSLPTFVYTAIPLLLLGVIVSHIHYPQLASMLCCTSYSHTCMQPHPTLV